jgi:hypothetical protein
MLMNAVIVILVIGFFKFITDRQIAALCAGFLFLFGPIYVLWSEKKAGCKLRSASWWGSLVFLFISALPIFLLRIMYWNQPFENLSMLGISGPRLHQVSNYLFIVMLLCFVVDSFLSKRQEIKKPGA